MSKNITIIDRQYKDWIADLSKRYRQSQVKAAVKVNKEMLRFYWSLGRDIVALKAEARWGDKFMKNLSADLKDMMPEATCFSETNILYMKNFYLLFPCTDKFTPQLVEQLDKAEKLITPQLVDELADSLVKSLGVDIFAIPWGHYRYLIDKYKNEPQKALFFVRKTIQEGWSRDMLLNFISTNLYEREGKALNNFTSTLPEPMSDLANEITKDPYNFAFAGITGKYNEKQLKKALLKNITEFLLELGTGFSYVGNEYRLPIGTKEKFVDLLFFHIPLNCYVVIEVKTGEFDFPDTGQLTGYVVACNHILKQPHHNPTIGILVCKSKDNLLAQYSLEGCNQPIGISEYELEKLYPTKVEGMIPTIEEIESKLTDRLVADSENSKEENNI
ncbi:MAG: DUF1016 family protein [Prevotella sp.]|nr:DUF1016 family protein [Candidatus Prevotella equi]